MRLRGHVYRIASRFPDGSGTEWTGKDWAWDVIDLDAPIVRIDAHPTIVIHGYADDQQAAYWACCGEMRLYQEQRLTAAFRARELREAAEAQHAPDVEVNETVPEGVWQHFVRLLTGR